MKAWRTSGKHYGAVVFADDPAGAIDQHERLHGESPDDVTWVPHLDGEPRERLSNAELQSAGLAVFCDRCLAVDAIVLGIDEPDDLPLAIIDGETVCDQCITPREKLAAGGDPDDFTYAEQYMDIPFGGLPREAVPLADLEKRA